MGEEPELRVIKNGHGWAAFILFIIYILLVYGTYSKSINTATPSMGGLSKAFAYSLAVWVYGMIVIIYAAVKAWK
ncbi:MAG: hypothetical protein GSR79_08995 [Desulfurococcales archaeon]|nr:hypothetical protein [Desulfurococcales archaeon]